MSCDTTSNECLQRDCDECGGPVVIGSSILLSKEEIVRLAHWHPEHATVENLIRAKAENMRENVVKAALREVESRGWQS